MYSPLAFCNSVIVGFCALGNLGVENSENPEAGAEWLVVRRLSKDEESATPTSLLLSGICHGGCADDESGVPEP